MIFGINGWSQEKRSVNEFDVHELDPIVQVFAGAKYDINQKL